MPAPLALAAIGAGTQFLGGAQNAAATAQQNRDSQQFSYEMYKKQYADNVAFWNMQNEYNSPQAQMKRFQDAGLNPHLIYGQGNSGNAGPISTPDVQSPQFRTPEWGNAISGAGLGFVNAIYDLDIKQAQLENLRAQNTVIKQEALLKANQTETGVFKLGFETEHRDISSDARKEQLRQLKTSTDISINEDARKAALNSSSIAEAAERMLTMREQRVNTVMDRDRLRAETARIRENIELMKRDGTLKDLEIGLREQGINPNDPMWSRIVGQFLTNLISPQSGAPGSSNNIWSRIIKAIR